MVDRYRCVFGCRRVVVHHVLTTRRARLHHRYDGDMAEGWAPEPDVMLANVPNYTFAEAARYLRMPASTVRYWAKGGVVTRPDRPNIRFEQVLDGPPRQRLAFSDLTELLIVRELREKFNVTPRAIRRAQEYVRTTLKERWYLYHLAVYGREIFIEHIEPAPVAASRSGQMAFAGFLDDVLQRVEIDAAGVPTRIFPRIAYSHTPAPVQISPFVSFGIPTITDTGIKVRTVARRYDAGEELDAIAADYGLAIDVIEDAISFHVAAA